jgi:two-component system, LytTR family, response regulator
MSMQVYIPTDRGIRIIPVNNIVRIEASSNYSKLFFNNDKPLIVAKVLHWFEDKLEEQFFYRIHRTHIVNRQFISTISIDTNMLTLANGEQFKISRRRKENILKRLA